VGDKQLIKRVTPREAKERWQFGRFLPQDVKKLRRFQRRLWRIERDDRG
jgi:hypothetical protein